MDVANTLMESYLNTRKQLVRLEEAASGFLAIQRGVAQCSKLLLQLCLSILMTSQCLGTTSQKKCNEPVEKRKPVYLTAFHGKRRNISAKHGMGLFMFCFYHPAAPICVICVPRKAPVPLFLHMKHVLSLPIGRALRTNVNSID